MPIICNELTVLLDIFGNEWYQRFCGGVFNRLHVNASKLLTIQFGGYSNKHLVLAAPANLVVFGLSADIVFVDFDCVGKLCTTWRNHRPTDFVNPRPYGFVAFEA